MIFIGLMVGTILLCGLVNNLFLDRYYMMDKLQSIYSIYDRICEISDLTILSEDSFADEMDELCNGANVTVCIIDPSSQSSYYSSNGGMDLESVVFDSVLGMPDNGLGGKNTGGLNVFKGFGAPAGITNTTELASGDSYVVRLTTSRDSEYLEMVGSLSTGGFFVMRSPMESIQESAAIANRFFSYVMIVCTMLGCIIIWIVSSRITGPILELSRISERMVQFDFESKYQGRGHAEINRLGENINTLSDTLAAAIVELKSANNELQKDIEKKEEIDEMRKEFLSNVSHELKTPIALIQGYAEGLKEGMVEDKESMDFYCDVIMDEAARMNTMVKKLLTLNQLEFGNDMVNMERFDLTAMIAGYLHSAEILTRQNEIQVTFTEEAPVFVWGDEFKMEEVFMNYFSNAVNHAQPGAEGVKQILISFEQRDEHVRVCVYNTGQPIPVESLPHLWEKFYKVDKARTREYGGSGVGLSIVKAIMESMHQRYGVRNMPDGVVFWFELEKA